MTMKRIGTVLGIAALLVVSYFIPTIVTTAEDNALEKVVRTYEIENVTISQNEDAFFEEMDNFPEILAQNMMYVKSGKNLTAEKVQEAVAELVKLLSDSYYTDTFTEDGFASLKHHEEYVYLTTSADYETVYYLWIGYFVDRYGREYTMYIDDTTGKVLGCSVPIPEYLLEDDAVAQEICSNLMEYYGYQGFEFEPPDASGESRMIFYDEEGKETLIVPLLFSGGMMHFNLVENHLTAEAMISSDSYSEEVKMKLGLY